MQVIHPEKENTKRMYDVGVAKSTRAWETLDKSLDPPVPWFPYLKTDKIYLDLLHVPRFLVMKRTMTSSPMFRTGNGFNLSHMPSRLNITTMLTNSERRIQKQKSRRAQWSPIMGSDRGDSQ